MSPTISANAPQREPGHPDGRPPAAPCGQVQGDPQEQEDAVLLDEHQRQRPHDRPHLVPPHELGEAECEQRQRKCDLVEVEQGHRLGAPRQYEPHPDRGTRPLAESIHRGSGHDPRGEPDEGCLGDQQQARVGPEPVERCQECDDRGEVVPEQVEATCGFEV
nr:hypothetical protein [Cellulomonas sp. P24]